MPGYGRIDHDHDYGIRLAGTAPDDDGPVWMVNPMRYKDRAEYADGRETSLTGREADDEYTPIGPLAAVGAEIVLVADVPHPPTDDDGAYTMVHVVRFHDEGGASATPDHMEAYQEVAGSVAVPNGVRIDGWFSVEGTIVGDGRSWHQVRFNTFPSRQAFMSVALDPDRLKAQAEHRETAIADTYAIGVRASINRLSASVEPVD